MAYGLRITSSAGRTILNESYAGYSYVQGGNVNIKSSRELGNRRGGSISIPSKYPDYLIAFKPPANVPLCYWFKHIYVPVNSNYSFNMPYKVFAKTSTVPASSERFGLRTWNSSGQLTFDSGNELFNIKSYKYYTKKGQSLWVGGDWVIPGCGGHIGQRTLGGGHTGTFVSYFLKRNGDNLTLDWGDLEIGPPVPGGLAGTFDQSGGAASVLRVDII